MGTGFVDLSTSWLSLVKFSTTISTSSQQSLFITLINKLQLIKILLITRTYKLSILKVKFVDFRQHHIFENFRHFRTGSEIGRCTVFTEIKTF